MESLEVKPCIIVCTETRLLKHYNSFNLAGYKIYYNGSSINIVEGVVTHIKDEIDEETTNCQNGKTLSTKVSNSLK